MIDNKLLDLQRELWNLYKDVNGVRPRYWEQEEWDSVEFLEEQRAILLDIVDKFTPLKAAFEGWTTVEA